MAVLPDYLEDPVARHAQQRLALQVAISPILGRPTGDAGFWLTHWIYRVYRGPERRLIDEEKIPTLVKVLPSNASVLDLQAVTRFVRLLQASFLEGTLEEDMDFLGQLRVLPTLRGTSVLTSPPR